MPTTTNVLLVHGAWHGAWCWDTLAPRLTSAGLDVTTVDLPSSGGGGDLAADAAVVRAALDGIDGPAVLVGHSYGGQAVSEASQGRDDVAHLVYLCAFMLDTGESLLGALAGQVPPWIAVDEATETSMPTTPYDVFYGDVDPSVAAAFPALLRPQTLSSFAAPLTGAGWHTIPSTYVGCTQDQAIPYPAQQAMSARAGSVVTLQTSHSPFVSAPDDVAAVVRAAAS